MSRTPDADVPIGETVVAALSGQSCTVVRDSIGEQLVVGFGPQAPTEWPLRGTPRATWQLYSRYGMWQVTDGIRTVASDEETPGADLIQRARAVLLHQHVTQVDVGTSAGRLTLRFDNGARLLLGPHADALPDEEAWALRAPGGVVVEARKAALTVARVPADGPPTTATASAAIHRVIRDVAAELGLRVFEPPPGDTAFDVVLTALDGTVFVVQVTKTGGVRTVAVPRDAGEPTTTDIPVDDLTPDAVADHVRQALSAA